MGQQVEDIAIAHDQKLPIYRVSSHSAMGQHEEENPITIVDEFKTSEKQNRSFREKQRKIKGYRPSPSMMFKSGDKEFEFYCSIIHDEQIESYLFCLSIFSLWHIEFKFIKYLQSFL